MSHTSLKFQATIYSFSSNELSFWIELLRFKNELNLFQRKNFFQRLICKSRFGIFNVKIYMKSSDPTANSSVNII